MKILTFIGEKFSIIIGQRKGEAATIKNFHLAGFDKFSVKKKVSLGNFDAVWLTRLACPPQQSVS